MSININPKKDITETSQTHISSNNLPTKSEVEIREKLKVDSFLTSKKHCFYTNRASLLENGQLEMNELYKRLAFEIDLHEKWIKNYQEVSKFLHEMLFDKFKEILLEFFKFEIKVR